MCMVSSVGDNFRDNFPNRWPNVASPIPVYAPNAPGRPDSWVGGYVPAAAFEKLKSEVAELRELLLAAKKYDEATGQKDCEMDDKVAFIKWLADFVGVDMKEVFK